jgi:hypothetical protein
VRRSRARPERAEELRRAALNEWLTHKVRPMFEERVLAVTEDVMFKWRLLVEEDRKARHTFAQPDLIIAATAFDLQHQPRHISGCTRCFRHETGGAEIKVEETCDKLATKLATRFAGQRPTH